MSAVAEKPGLMEMMGRAVNATNLSTVEGREGNVERLAALAYAQLNPSAQQHGENEFAEINAGAALGSLLIRIKAGRRPDAVPIKEALQAVDMLTHFVRQQRYFAKWKLKDGRGLLQAFVRQCLAEWLNDVCLHCDGVEWQGIERAKVREKRVKCRACRGVGTVKLTHLSKKSKQPVTLTTACAACRGFRSILREGIPAIRPRQCAGCRGTGRRLADDAERARVLGIALRAYEHGWARRFEWMRERLDRLDGVEKNLLQVQLGRGINRP